jgi:hypothetical protein
MRTRTRKILVEYSSRVQPRWSACVWALLLSFYDYRVVFAWHLRHGCSEWVHIMQLKAGSIPAYAVTQPFVVSHCCKTPLQQPPSQQPCQHAPGCCRGLLWCSSSTCRPPASHDRQAAACALHAAGPAPYECAGETFIRHSYPLQHISSVVVAPSCPAQWSQASACDECIALPRLHTGMHC